MKLSDPCEGPRAGLAAESAASASSLPPLSTTSCGLQTQRKGGTDGGGSRWDCFFPPDTQETRRILDSVSLAQALALDHTLPVPGRFLLIPAVPSAREALEASESGESLADLCVCLFSG